MEHHVYAVWDFISLVKSLQTRIARPDVLRSLSKRQRYVSYINQIALEEEEDNTLMETFDVTNGNHFECYRHAMAEVGADIEPISRFVDMVNNKSIETALKRSNIPAPARQFMTFTFDIVGRNQLHLLAAALTYGRETLVPKLFRPLLRRIKVSRSSAPNLYGYLERHIQLDEQEHGPLAIRMVQELCEGQTERLAEAVDVAEQSLTVRLDLWDGIHEALIT